MDDNTQTQPNVKILKNGAVYDLDKKRIVSNPGGGLAAFTPETSRQAKERLKELKRQAILDGAAEALDKAKYPAPSNLDVIQAIAAAAMVKALDPANAKQIDAARFILQESGLSETQANAGADSQQLGGDLAQAIAEIIQALRPLEVIDAESTDIRNETGEV